MKLKVCGLKYPQNINQLFDEVEPDFAGFIFHAASPRYAANLFHEKPEVFWHARVRKVGVFVNSSPECIKTIYRELPIDHLQLHGDETAEYCLKLKETGFSVIKSFSIDPHFNFATLGAYREAVDYFLFDTRGDFRGGNGIKFNWEKLREYPFDNLYFLSGGIAPEDVQKISELADERLFAVDINSRFEISPGKKDVTSIKEFYKKIKL